MNFSDATISRNMADFHAAVTARMKELKWSTYKLAQELKGKRHDGTDVPMQTVYSFVRDGSPINSRDLGLIFEAIGLSVTSVEQSRKRR